jgi:hypothetical protein
MTASTVLRELRDHPAPGLVLKNWGESPVPFFGVHISHRFEPPATVNAHATLCRVADGDDSIPLCSFFEQHDGVELCLHANACRKCETALLKLHPVGEWELLTAKFQPGGEYDWTVKHNRYRNVCPLYRSSERWVAFATVDELPACLTTFISGSNAGQVFFLTPEPRFNIARPIAKTFAEFLSLVAADVAALLRRFEVQVSFAAGDGGFASFIPWKYVPDSRGHPDFHGRDPFV